MISRSSRSDAQSVRHHELSRSRPLPPAGRPGRASATACRCSPGRWPRAPVRSPRACSSDRSTPPRPRMAITETPKPASLALRQASICWADGHALADARQRLVVARLQPDVEHLQAVLPDLAELLVGAAKQGVRVGVGADPLEVGQLGGEQIEDAHHAPRRQGERVAVGEEDPVDTLLDRGRQALDVFLAPRRRVAPGSACRCTCRRRCIRRTSTRT